MLSYPVGSHEVGGDTRPFAQYTAAVQMCMYCTYAKTVTTQAIKGDKGAAGSSILARALQDVFASFNVVD